MLRPLVSVALLDILSMIASSTPSGDGSVSGLNTWIPIDVMLEILRDLVKAFPKPSKAQAGAPIASANPFSVMMASILDQVSSSM